MKASEEHSESPVNVKLPLVGWVPTANGRLSFRHVGEGEVPSICLSANVSTSTIGRCVLGYQERNLSDALFRDTLSYILRVSGRFWFVIACKSDTLNPSDDSFLSGHVYIYKSHSDWLRISSALEADIKRLHELRGSIDLGRDKKIKSIFELNGSKLDETFDIKVPFVLHRDGETEVGNPSYREAELGSASNEYAAASGLNFDRWVCNQAYFFIRDVTHGHQHHSPKVDTLIILQERDNDDRRWREHILFSLHYYVIRVRRGLSSEDLYRATGVLAYARSFELLSNRKLEAELVPFNSNELGNSMSARALELNTIEARQLSEFTLKLNRKAGVRNFVIALLAIVVAFIAIFLQPRVGQQKEDGTPRFPQLDALADYLSSNLTTIMQLIVAIIITTFIGTITVSPRKYKFLQDLYRALLPRYRLVPIVGMLAALFIGGLSLYNYWPEVISIYKIISSLVQLR